MAKLLRRVTKGSELKDTIKKTETPPATPEVGGTPVDFEKLLLDLLSNEPVTGMKTKIFKELRFLTTSPAHRVRSTLYTRTVEKEIQKQADAIRVDDFLCAHFTPAGEINEIEFSTKYHNYSAKQLARKYPHSIICQLKNLEYASKLYQVSELFYLIYSPF